MQCKYQLICGMCHWQVEAGIVGKRDWHDAHSGFQVQKAAMVTCKELNVVMPAVGVLKVMPRRS